MIYQFQNSQSGFLDRGFPVSNDWVAAALDTLQKNTLARSDIEDADFRSDSYVAKTPLMECYEIAGKLILMKEGHKYDQSEVDIKPIGAAAASKNIAIYDPWRYESLFEFLNDNYHS